MAGAQDAIAAMMGQSQPPGAPQMVPAGQQQPQKPVPNNRVRSAIKKRKGIVQRRWWGEVNYNTRLGASGAVLGILITVVHCTGFEGLDLTPTIPVKGDVPTVVLWRDRGRHPRQRAPHARPSASSLLEAKLPVYEKGMVACIKEPADAVPDKSYIAFLSFTYNVGVTAFCNSTLDFLLNQGDLADACKQLPRWVYLGTTKLPGLVNRRAAEEALCLEGVK